ncbi:MAG: hypothetical protein V2A79_16275 [Planctomycetota bacterium]
MKADDPVVERVRAARRQIAERCGQDHHRLYEWAKQIEAQQRERVIGYERPREPKK